MKMNNQKFGSIIRKKRKEMHLTQEKFAEMTGVTAGFIGQVERGETYPSIQIFMKMVNILNLDTNEIFNPSYYKSENNNTEFIILFQKLNKNNQELAWTLIQKLIQMQNDEEIQNS